MTAQAPEQASDNFSLAKLGDDVRLVVTFGRICPGREFVFILRVEIESDTERLKERFAGRKYTNHEWRVERLAQLLTTPPTGLPDFPTEGNLAENVRRYFAPEASAGGLLLGLFEEYTKAVLPDQLFR